MAPLKYATPSRSAFLALGTALLIFITPSVSGALQCEDLPVDKCAFAVSSIGLRCMLEKKARNDGTSDYKCQTSSIMAERPGELIESERCVRTCGLQRLSVGFSTDALLEHEFLRKLCFSHCRTTCPNINDLYTNLAAGEGTHLDKICNSFKERVRRTIHLRASARQATKAWTSTTTNSARGMLYAEEPATSAYVQAPTSGAKPPKIEVQPPTNPLATPPLPPPPSPPPPPPPSPPPPPPPLLFLPPPIPIPIPDLFHGLLPPAAL